MLSAVARLLISCCCAAGCAASCAVMLSISAMSLTVSQLLPFHFCSRFGELPVFSHTLPTAGEVGSSAPV